RGADHRSRVMAGLVQRCPHLRQLRGKTSHTGASLHPQLRINGTAMFRGVEAKEQSLTPRVRSAMLPSPSGLIWGLEVDRLRVSQAVLTSRRIPRPARS